MLQDSKIHLPIFGRYALKGLTFLQFLSGSLPYNLFQFSVGSFFDTQSGLYTFRKYSPNKQTVSQERFLDDLTLNIITRDSYILGDHLDFRPYIPLGECECQVRADSLLYSLFIPDKVCIKRMER